MRILLIGNFAPPYEEENLNNFTLLKKLKEEKHKCTAINISNNPSKEEGIVNTNNFMDFIFKLIRYAWKMDVIHFSTKGYMRPGLMKLIASTLVGRFFRAKPVITLYSEMFAVIGKTRSKLLGKPSLRITFSLAHRVICNDKDTYETAATFKTKNNFELIPLFIHIPENIKENESLVSKKLKNKDKVIVFSNVRYPSFLFEILNSLLSKSLDSDIGIVVSLSEKLSAKLQHVIEEAGKRLAENLVFIESDNLPLLLQAYSRVNFTIRPLSCDGSIFFGNFAVSLKKPVHLENYLYFPSSLLLIKEGETADLCSRIINNLLMETAEKPTELAAEDFYAKIKEIYSTRESLQNPL